MEKKEDGEERSKKMEKKEDGARKGDRERKEIITHVQEKVLVRIEEEKGRVGEEGGGGRLFDTIQELEKKITYTKGE